jgi:inosose dehydratase
MPKAGLAGIEVFTTHLEPYYAKPKDFKALLTKAGIRLSGAYYNHRGLVEPADQADALTQAEFACRFLGAVGGEFLIVNGGIGKADRPVQPADVKNLANFLNTIAGRAKACKVGVVVHPHWKCTVETPQEVDALLAAGLDAAGVGLCVHATHQFLTGADPYAIYEKHARLVRYAHIGTASREGGADFEECLLDQKRLMKALTEAGYNGWLTLESRKKDVAPADYAAKAVAYMHATWPNIRWE